MCSHAPDVELDANGFFKDGILVALGDDMSLDTALELQYVCVAHCERCPAALTQGDAAPRNPSSYPPPPPPVCRYYSSRAVVDSRWVLSCVSHAKRVGVDEHLVVHTITAASFSETPHA